MLFIFLPTLTLSSPNGIDALIAEETVPANEAWQEHLAEVIKAIEDRNWKTSNLQTRKEALIAYVSLLRQHFCQEDISFRLGQLSSAFVRCVKAEDDTTEAVLALKGILCNSHSWAFLLTLRKLSRLPC